MARVNELADAYVRDYFHRYPDAATLEGYPEADHGRLHDNSLEAVRACRFREWRRAQFRQLWRGVA